MTVPAAFEALQEMNQVSRLHWLVYDNFHFENKPLNEEPALLEWLSNNGVDAARFREIYRSPAISAKRIP